MLAKLANNGSGGSSMLACGSILNLVTRTRDICTETPCCFPSEGNFILKADRSNKDISSSVGNAEVASAKTIYFGLFTQANGTWRLCGEPNILFDGV